MIGYCLLLQRLLMCIPILLLCTFPPSKTNVILPSHISIFFIHFFTLRTVMTRAEGWEDIEDFGVHLLDWLQKRGFFKHGIPGHDTIDRVISQLEPALLQQYFIDWMCDVSARTEGELVAIDSKTLRSSWLPGNRSSAIHMVSTFACANSLVLGQVKTDEKSKQFQSFNAC
jgi:hypothetical protein